jgi:CRP-like cAMP-binding protein
MPQTKLIERLRKSIGLREDDSRALASMPMLVKSFRNGEYISREGERITQCCLVLSGFLYRQKVIGGRTQILSYYVPGDLPDLHSLHLPVMDHDLRSAGNSKVAFVSHAFLRPLLQTWPSLAHVLWRETLVDAAINREWVASLGSRNALSRTAHLICELACRLEIVGESVGDEFQVPLTQQQLADITGLSTVHLNRTLQELRRRGLIVWRKTSVALLNRKELEEIAEFQPDYLHQGVYREGVLRQKISVSGAASKPS